MKKIVLASHLAHFELKRKLTGIKYFAEIDITDNCNLRCGHCYHFHGKNVFEKKELPLGVWKKRFRTLHRGGIRCVLLVGGEPALRADVLMLAHNIFPFVYVITNGTVFIPKKFNHLLFVSLDGMRETNDIIRGRDTFDRVLKNYSGDKRVAINMTITMDNYRELENVVRLSKKHGFRGVVCNICASGTDVKVPMHIKADERKTVMKELRRVKEKYPKQFLLSDAMLRWYEKADHRGRCYWGDDVLHFDVNWKKRRCFGSNADCSNCGCLAGSFQNPFLMAFTAKEFRKLV
ncbi:MAG: radical SAM protein [Candidatus Thermoplasmatota archaeon]|nr:radical SAM protein [Euryarchaeota archaeon]MBU4032876.1 radical SAM protein [Candidatus Thermoplasmatota archaeon]MBU4072036.1 radical SAM protein [Candidatus Thermoplasmatota archaeon]MBU4144567.1 radical SAM protein [Candidatus Thermoplasmatota archaeon]MBU4592116.1 radical SAM protein [Candidatus Thermoplasmatota archaeon]